MKKNYRTGAVGAILDEYERAIDHLKTVIADIDDDTLTRIVDPNTADENCRSFQTILSHVVHSGYGYATSIHNLKGHNVTRQAKSFHSTVQEYLADLTGVFTYTEKVLSEFNEEELEQFDPALKIKAGWGQVYDVEQMMEHAIVHILRHRRQIEKFKYKN
jgi:uncharacterized damage-inducible protein DinB